MPIGTVEKVEEDYVIVSIERQDMCGECHACEMLGEVKKCTLKCVNECKSQVGDQVEVDVEQRFLYEGNFYHVWATTYWPYPRSRDGL